MTDERSRRLHLLWLYAAALALAAVGIEYWKIGEVPVMLLANALLLDALGVARGSCRRSRSR